MSQEEQLIEGQVYTLGEAVWDHVPRNMRTMREAIRVKVNTRCGSRWQRPLLIASIRLQGTC